MNQQELQALMKSFEATTLTRLEYEENGLRLVLERAALPITAAAIGSVTATAGAAATALPASPATVPGTAIAGAVAAAAADPAAPTANSAPAGGNYIKAPVVGTFYIAPSPESAPFVTVGSSVKKGDTVCILEAMKMINEVQAPCDCVIEEVSLADGALAGFDDGLFRIREL